MQKKLYIETQGCQMNVDDSSRMRRLLVPLGYTLTAIPEEADLVLINTCSVREKASHKAHSAVGRYFSFKQERPDMLLGLTGCQAQAEGQKLLGRFQYLDFVLGPDQVSHLPALIADLEKGKPRSVNQTERVKPQDFQFASFNLQEGESLASAYVTIMKGCDNFCSFCIVPFVRGREVSRPSEQILKEIRSLCDHGVKEVTLLGQNVNSYGTQGSEISFVQLLYRIAEETPVQRLRFTTSHPKDIGENLLKAFCDLPILAKHLHLPVQSGSDAVLKKMYRTYTREEYLTIVRRLRELCPEVSLSTDIIVGFPGEREEDFQQTLHLVEEASFDASYSFHYSPRPHTTAARYFEDDVPRDIKDERLKLLQQRQARLTLQKHEACVGKVFEVLVEGPSKTGVSLQGRSSHNRVIHFASQEASCVGEFVPVKVTQALPNSLLGQRV